MQFVKRYTLGCGGLLIVMPNGTLTPPLTFAAQPSWEQHWAASALLRVEGIDPSQTEPATLADLAFAWKACRAVSGRPFGC